VLDLTQEAIALHLPWELYKVMPTVSWMSLRSMEFTSSNFATPGEMNTNGVANGVTNLLNGLISARESSMTV
jgi:hypothetical protein